MYILTIQVQLCVTIGGYVQYVMEVFVKWIAVQFNYVWQQIM